MENVSFDSDTDIQWLSIEPPEKKRKPAKKIGFYLLVFAAFLVSCLAIGAVVKKIQLIAESRNKVITVASQRKRDVLNTESSEAFRSFDGLIDPQSQLSGNKLQERIEIEALFAEIETIVQKNDIPAFQAKVNYNQLLKRIEILGTIRHWSRLEKKYLRSELKSSVGMDSNWKQTTLAAILDDRSDSSSRIVYAYCWEELTEEYNEYRFLVSHTDQGWKLYDWERLDLGLSASREWSIYAKYGTGPEMDNYTQWNNLISEADTLSTAGDYKAAEAKLRLAELERVPSELQDYCWLLTGYRWQAYGETDEAERCFKEVTEPDNTPGAYYGLMASTRSDNPSRALAYAEKYENVVGPTPDLCRIKAQISYRLGHKQKATKEWKKIARILPEDTDALTQIYKSTPEEDRSSFDTYLEERRIPISTVVEIANAVSYSDFPALLHLVEYLQSKEPTSARTLDLEGLAKHLDGQYAVSAGLFQQAINLEVDPEQKKTYVNHYLDAMAANGQVIAGWKNSPDPLTAFEWLTDGRDEEELSYSQQEYEQLVELFLQSHPTEPIGLYHAAILAIENNQFKQAEGFLQKALGVIRSNPDKEDYEYRQHNCYYLLTQTLFKQGKIPEAYEVSEDRSQRFRQLVSLAQNDDRWRDLKRLLEIHRENEPEDPYLFFAMGEIAVHGERWSDAIDHFLRGVEAAEIADRWYFKNRLRRACVKSGQWQESYQQSKDPSKTFGALAEAYVEDKNWDSFNQLLAHHRKQSPNDPRIVQAESSAAWELEDYATFSALAQSALSTEDSEILPEYDRYRLEERLFSALLRTQAFDKAQEIAQADSGKQNDATSLAITQAARGNRAEALILASKVADQNESASSFYLDDDVGQIFLDKYFSVLHKEYPVSLPYNIASDTTLFLSDSPFHLESKEIVDALDELSLTAEAPPQFIEVLGKEGRKAIVLRWGQATLWFATGSGKYNEKWKIDNEANRQEKHIDLSQEWMAVNVIGWTARQRKEAEKIVRQLAAQLTKGRAKTLCVESEQIWGQTIAFPINENLITAWVRHEKLDAFQESSVVIKEENSDKKMGGDRQFRSNLYDAMRSFEADPNRRLEVMISLTDKVTSDPLWLSVSKAKRSYGSIDFEGYLLNHSRLVPQLTVGLPVSTRENKVRAWRFKGEETVFRP